MYHINLVSQLVAVWDWSDYKHLQTILQKMKRRKKAAKRRKTPAKRRKKNMMFFVTFVMASPIELLELEDCKTYSRANSRLRVLHGEEK